MGRIEAGPQRLADNAYREIKEQILSCELRPGQMIKANQLAESLEMSRTPVHEALKSLVNEGFLHVISRVGYVVSSVSVNDVQDIFQLRLTLELLGVDLGSGRMTKMDVDTFVGRQREFQSAAQSLCVGSPKFVRLAMEAHREFHVSIASLSGNWRLGESVSRLLDESQRVMSVDPLTHDQINFLSSGQHRRIFDAVKAGDRDEARDAVITHVRDAQERVVQCLLAKPGLVDESSLLSPPLGKSR